MTSITSSRGKVLNLIRTHSHSASGKESFCFNCVKASSKMAWYYTLLDNSSAEVRSVARLHVRVGGD